MKLGWVGLGKLGAPAAATFARAGHRVVGYDLQPVTVDTHPNLTVAATLADAVADADVVFIAVQTPHGPGYGGEQPAPAVPVGFDTRALCDAVDAVAAATPPSTVIAVVSTVLPGTCRAELLPLAGEHPFVYHPFFIAMGSVEDDLLHPEFVLFGTDEPAAAVTVAAVYEPIHSAPRRAVRIESAEVAKVVYNTLIGMKILAANSVMEITDKLGGDCDEVTDVLGLATRRILSSAYLSAGMGDAGPCHPRDAIAMQHLAERLNLSADVFGFAVRAREAQTRWLARVASAARAAVAGSPPVVVMGRAYKMGVDLEDGSAALLLCWYLRDYGHHVINVDAAADVPTVGPAVFVVAKRDPAYAAVPFPAGSVVVDPWGIVADIPDVTVHRVGRP